ncbi:DNA-directed DNA polymerase [Tanacetum coccineum]
MAYHPFVNSTTYFVQQEYMTRSLTKKLLTPFEEPERNQSEEEVTEVMTEPTMEEYMMKTQEDYGLGIARPKIDEKSHFELKGQFLRELHDNTLVDRIMMMLTDTLRMTRSTETFDGLATIQAQLNNLGREIKKVNERVYDAQVGCESCRRYKAAAIGFYQRDNRNPSYQERRQTMEELLSKFMAKSARRRDENSNLIKEIRASTDDAIRNQGASIKALEIQIRKMRKVLQERGSGSLPNLAETNLRDHVKSISTTVETNTPSIHRASVSVMPYSDFTYLGLGELAPTKLIIELADRTIKCPKGIAENVLVGINKFVFPVDFIVLDMPEDVKVPLILGRPFLSTAHAKIDVFKRKITLRVGLRERMELDLEARLIGEALILNRSLDPTYGDYIKLNDLNEPLEIRINPVEDLGLTIEEGEVINESIDDIVKTKNDDNEISNRIDEYPSFCNFDRKLLKIWMLTEIKTWEK